RPAGFGKPFLRSSAALGEGRQDWGCVPYLINDGEAAVGFGEGSGEAPPISATNYAAFEVPPSNLAPPVGTNAPFLITLFTNLPSGNTLIEFQSIPNRSYTILYGPEATLSSNVLAAQPSIAAPADRTQWIDAGPPKTVAHPTNTSARFYRVQLNP